MKDKINHYSPIRHENAAVVVGLKELYNSYDEKNKCRLIDYLSEWALPFSIKKDVVEMIKLKVDNNIDTEWGFYSIFERIINKSKENPEDFMFNLLGEKEWGELSKKLSRRRISDVSYFKNFIENETSKDISGKGRHHDGYVYRETNNE